MKDIRPFLIYDSFRYGIKDPHFETKYELEIVQIDSNPYYIEFGDKTKQWELRLTPCTLDKVEEDAEWYRDEDQTLRFKMSGYQKPNIEMFSQHIYDELRAVLQAIECTDEDYVWDVQQKMMGAYKEFTPQQVYNFIKNIHKNYSDTQDFLNVYDAMYERMHQSMKFAMYVLEGNGAMFTMSYDYPIGEHLLAFLELGEMYDHYE